MNLNTLLILTLLLSVKELFLNTVLGYNVLGIVTSPLKSHNHQISALFKELANSGHSVTVLSPHPQYKRVNHYLLENLLRHEKQEKYKNPWHYKKENGKLAEILQAYEKGEKRLEVTVQDPNFKRVINAHLSIDIILIDYDFNEALVGLGKVFNCPVAILITGGQLRGLLPRFSDLSYPFNNYFNLMQIWSSQGSSGGDSYFKIFNDLFINIIEQFYIDFYYYGKQVKTYNELISPTDENVDFSQLSNLVKKIFISRLPLGGEGPFSIDRIISTQSKIVDITGFHLPQRESFFEQYSMTQQSSSSDMEFSEELEKFIHSADDGCIYLSLGDIDPVQDLPRNLIQTIFKILYYERTEKVIWSFGSGNTSIITHDKIRNKFLLKNWLPQNEILQHSNIVKLFITSGGEISLIESIQNEIPIIGIPLNEEQETLLKLMASYELGVILHPENVTSESLRWALIEVLENEKYQDNMRILSELILERPFPSMKTFKFWLDHIFRSRKLGNIINKFDNNYHGKNNLSGHRLVLSSLYYHMCDFYFVIFIALVIAVISVSKYLYKIAIKTRKVKIY